MEPQIRYARSADGTNIAYATLGQGRPLIFVGGPNNLLTLDSDWRIPRVRRAIEQFAERRMFVRTDARGRGLSDRDVSDRSLDAHIADLQCVVDSLSGSSVDLMASGAAVVSAFAAAHPERVRKAVICLTLALRDRLSPLRRKLGELAAIDFDFFKQALALRNFGWVEGRIAAEQMQELTLEEMNSGYRTTRGWNDALDLPRVQCPVLVVHRRGAEMDVPLSVSRLVASSLPKGELRVVEAEGTTTFDEEGLVARAIIEFLDRDEPAADAPKPPSGMTAILFADIADSTALTERLGDDAFREKARGLDAAMRTAIRENGGAAVEGKTLGDGVLAVFTSAKQAIACAQACHAAASAAELALHAGIHAGDVIREADNVYGGAVNIAARVAAASASGETLVSDTVRSLARTSAGVVFEDRGERALKGIDEAVRIWAVVRSAV